MKPINIIKKFLFVLLILVSMLVIYNRNEELSACYSISGYYPVEVFVSEGDTAWALQKKLLKNNKADIRYLLFEAEKINDVDLGSLKPGDVIYLYSSN